MSDQGQPRVVQAHEALHAPLHPAACQDGKGPVDDAATGFFAESSAVPESLGDLIEWCKEHDLYKALERHNDLRASFCLPLYIAIVIGYDIKQERQVIQINFASTWFLLNAVRAIETGWVNQLNGDATFGFCRADIDMIALGFCSFVGSNNSVCFSYIPHQS